MLFINKLFNSIACLLSFTNLQLVIPGRTWILLYLGRTVYKRLWACLALYEGVWHLSRGDCHGDTEAQVCSTGKTGRPVPRALRALGTAP